MGGWLLASVPRRQHTEETGAAGCDTHMESPFSAECSNSDNMRQTMITPTQARGHTNQWCVVQAMYDAVLIEQCPLRSAMQTVGTCLAHQRLNLQHACNMCREAPKQSHKHAGCTSVRCMHTHTCATNACPAPSVGSRLQKRLLHRVPSGCSAWLTPSPHWRQHLGRSTTFPGPRRGPNT